MKTYIVAAAALLLTSSAVLAAPGKSFNRYHGGGYHSGKVTPAERAAIARSQFRLNVLIRRAWADGRLNFFEKARIRIAESRHKSLVARARRT